MGKLLRFFKGYEKQAVLAPLFKLLEALMDLMVPLFIAGIINEGIAAGNRQVIWQYFFVLLVLAALGMGFSFTSQWFSARASVGFATALRQALFDHISALSYRELDRLGTDTLITRMTSDVNQIQTGVNMALRLLLRSPFIVLGAMLLAFTIDVKCAVIFTIAIPVLSVVVFGIMLLCLPLYRKVQESLDQVLKATRENLTGVRVIRAFGKEADEIREFDKKNLELTRRNEFVGKLSALMNPVTFLLINVAAMLLIRQGAVRVQIGSIQQGDVVALYNYMAQITVELIKLASLIITINKSLASANRVADIFEVSPGMEYPVSSPGISLTEEEEVVCFDNVSFSYVGSAGNVLENISFSVKRGQTVGIIGGTGSGKTTLVHLLSRFYDVTGGSVLVDGRDVRDYPMGGLREKIGIVPQKAVLFEGSIRDNLKLGKEDASDAELLDAVQIAQAGDVVASRSEGLSAEILQAGKNLSGGQRQRLTIARALVKQPEILILDDASSALDYATDRKLRSALQETKSDTTVFLISQRTTSIQDADQILVLDDGKMAGLGTHRELLNRCQVYREIYDSQHKGEETAR